MEGFDKKTLKVSRGYNYTYYVSDSTHKTDPSLPSLLFSHGWPDCAYMWEGIANELRSLPFKLIIPDLLGYAGTDKPTDPAAYKYDGITKDIADILDAEKIEKVISIGHDWGSVVAVRVYNYYPDRVAGVILLNVPYLPPSKDKFDLDTVNAVTKEAFGYPFYMYWHFFTSPEAPALLKEKVDRLYSAMFAKGETAMQDFFCTTADKFPNYLKSDSEEVEVRDYAKDPAFKKRFVDRLGKDGFEGAQQYYVTFKDNWQWECDSKLPDENSIIKVPFFYLGCTEDAVCRPESMIPAKEAGLLPDIEESPMVVSGHWSPFEKPKEMAGHISAWLQKRYLKK